MLTLHKIFDVIGLYFVGLKYNTCSFIRIFVMKTIFKNRYAFCKPRFI